VSAQKPREIAARILLQRESGSDFVENLLDAELSRANLSPADRGLCTELVYGTVRRQKTLDWLIARKTQPGRNQKAELKILLRLGLYQIFWLGRIPDHAAVHETVELAKNSGFAPQAGFLNAVLRGYVREKIQTEQLLENLKATDLATAFSHPDWLVERWRKRWGLEKTRDLLEWNNLPAYTFARVNTLKSDAENLQKIWQNEGVKFTAKQFDWAENDMVFQLDSHPPLARLGSFRDGLFYIQDPSTLLSVHELAPVSGETILDACAAPGGKTTFIAQHMQNRGKILAEDVHSERLALIRENYIRLGITCVETALAPREIPAETSRRFDRILIDAPCSNTGVLRRRVDLRWRIRPEEIERLRAAQLQILRQNAERLKPGGTLVYSTCSLEPEENRDVVDQFLAEHTQFTLEKERALVPFVESVDGAYVAKLKLAV
jgi:16S rRNA (cytosine967-C5)-methyltransferase